jgi:hypothetical protein
MIRFLLALAVLGRLAWGQAADSAVIVGNVSDSTGGLMPGARVRLTHLATGSAYSAESNAAGYYRTPPLRPGEYVVEVEAQGFKRTTRRGVVLNVGDTRQVDITLEVGQVTEQVEVAAEAPLLQTTEGATNTVMENRQILELPLNGRDYLQLARISAGVAPPPRGEFGSAQGISVGGSQATQVNFLIDGIDNNNQSIASQGEQKEAIKPQIDAVQEFKIVTNAYSAEYGRSMGGVVTLTTKSGSNEFHGTLFEFLRNEKMDAKNFFVPAAAKKPQFRRNQYGFAAGGPVIKNRMFLFGDGEWTKIRESATSVNTLPSLVERTGDFSGNATRIFDPATYSAASGTRQPFPNNIIPASQIDPVSARVRTLYPAPQIAATTRNFTYIRPRRSDLNRWDARFDHTLNERTNYYFRISGQHSAFTRVENLPDTADGLLKQGNNTNITNRQLAFIVNRVIRPSLVLSVRTGWSFIDTAATNQFDGPKNPAIGLNLRNGLDTAVPGISAFNVTGFTGIGGNAFNFINSQTRQLSGDASWTRGSHTVKFGMAAFWLQSGIFNTGFGLGQFNFDGRFTENPTPRGGGLPLADFLLGTAFSAQSSNYRYMQLRAPWFQQYVQDDWRVSKNLTINLGLRYELNLPWVEKNNKLSNWDIDTNPANPQFVVAGSENGSRSARALVSTDKTNFAPRFGFAYQLRRNTVVRGGYGLFFANVMNSGGGEFMQVNPPIHLAVLITTDRLNPTIQLRNGLAPLNPRNAPPLQPSSFERDAPWPVAQQWNLNIQRQLPGDLLWEIGYVGSKGNHIVRHINLNYARPGPGDINSRRRFRTALFPGTDIQVPLSSAHNYRNDANSLYHGLQTKVEKRFSKGSTFLASYAWSRAIGDYAFIPGEDRALGADWNVQDPLNVRAERSLLNQHVKHRLVGSYLYELPFGRNRKFGANWNRTMDAVAGGWMLGGITSLLSGFPMNVSVVGNPSNTGDLDRPDVVGEWRISRDRRGPDRWFNQAAFARNQPFRFGNAGRNILESPGTVRFDLTAHKDFRFTERIHSQFRAEVFNATNTPIFDGPNLQVGNPNFGLITNAGAPRILQLGLKILF